jgi:hypothetical protein
MEAAGKRHIVYGSRSDVITIWDLADLHILSRACAENRLRADIQEIANDPFSFWLGTGDNGDYIGLADKRFRASNLAEWVTVEDLADLGMTGARKIKELLEPIKAKCLGLGLGNHEDSYQIQNNQNIHGWLCKELGVPNLQYSGLFDVCFHRKSSRNLPKLVGPFPLRPVSTTAYRIFYHHGAGGAITPGGKLKRLIDAMGYFDADLYFLGHVHGQAYYPMPRVGADATCGKLVEKVSHGVITGAYLKTYEQGCTGYGEVRMYAPSTLGMTGLRVRPDHGTAGPVGARL